MYNAGPLGPVVHPVLRQGPEWPQPRPQGQHHVSIAGGRDCRRPRAREAVPEGGHGGLAALVAEGPQPLWVRAGEGVVVQVGRADRGLGEIRTLSHYF